MKVLNPEDACLRKLENLENPIPKLVRNPAASRSYVVSLLTRPDCDIELLGTDAETPPKRTGDGLYWGFDSLFKGGKQEQ